MQTKNQQIDAENAYTPMHVMELELSQPLPTIFAINGRTGQPYHRALCLIRLHMQPLGVIELSLTADGLQAEKYAAHIWQHLGQYINEHLRYDGLPTISELTASGLTSPSKPRCLEERERFFARAPFVSVIVPTHDRPERLQLCLHSLLALDYPHYEIIVVDNAPSSGATAQMVEQVLGDDPQIHYLREDRPGPSWARNSGMMAARGEILAFVDDDVVVDSNWLLELVRGFSHSQKVACVTSLILPMEMETPPQFWIEEYGGFSKEGYSKGFSRRIFDMKENRPKMPLYPYIAGRFGSGCSMAFRATFLRSVHGFDPALGGNGTAPCGQDIASFFQVVIRGYKLVYEPASVAYHPHHRNYTNLRKQIYNYGVGFTAFLMKSVLERPSLLPDLLSKVPYGLFRFLKDRPSKNRHKSSHYPKELITIELKGLLYGPFAYIQSLWALHKSRKMPSLVEARRILPIEKEI